MNALEPLFPALHKLEPLGLPATFEGWVAYASLGQAARLAAHLKREFALLEGAESVDQAYLRSDGFRANVVQAVRAAEVAESEAKLRLIARALAGCTLLFPAPAVDKFQTMRLVEQLSEREFEVLARLFSVNALDPFGSAVGAGATLAGFSREEGQAALLGLAQLGLLRPKSEEWEFTSLARQLALLARLVAAYDL